MTLLMDGESVTVDSLINRLLSTIDSRNRRERVLKRREIFWLLEQATSVFKSQPVFLEVLPPVTICGDIHGQYSDLLKLFSMSGSPDLINYLFLGDYVDRGRSSIKTICLLLCYKIKYPKNFIMLRGNHECADINRMYGFYDECMKVYGNTDVWYAFNECFDWMPISAIIDGRILCIHGGIAPELKSIQQLKEIERPSSVPDGSLISNVLWSDPDKTIGEWEDSDRGVSFLFGEDPLTEFMNGNNLDLIVRAHQVVDAGYDFPFSPSYSIVTVFSAPNYCGDCKNKASIMHVNEHLVCSFSVFLSEENTTEVIPRPMSPPSIHEHPQPTGVSLDH